MLILTVGDFLAEDIPDGMRTPPVEHLVKQLAADKGERDIALSNTPAGQPMLIEQPLGYQALIVVGAIQKVAQRRLAEQHLLK